jgi:GNAT superfamily N-acetyltransferase
MDIMNDDAYIYDIETLPQYRNRGIGKGLLAFAAARAEDVGIEKVYLFVKSFGKDLGNRLKLFRHAFKPLDPEQPVLLGGMEAVASVQKLKSLSPVMFTLNPEATKIVQNYGKLL